MLGVDLRKAEDFAVCQRAAVLLLNLLQILDFLGREGQAFLLVVSGQVFHIFDGLWLDVHREHTLVQTFVYTLQHRVEHVLGHLTVNCQL